MPARPSWEGHLRLSLVTCPVALFPATSEAETIRFNLINPQNQQPHQMKTVDAGTGEEVSRDATWSKASGRPSTVRAARQGRFEAVKLESTRTSISRSRSARRLDRLYWDTAYHLMPSSKTGTRRLR